MLFAHQRLSLYLTLWLISCSKHVNQNKSFPKLILTTDSLVLSFSFVFLSPLFFLLAFCLELMTSQSVTVYPVNASCTVMVYCDFAI